MMNLQRLLFISTAVALSLPARAGSCLTIDPEKDSLTPDEQKAAMVVMEAALESAGREIVTQDCVDTYTLTHARLGNSITAVLEGPEGSRSLPAANLEDLPAAYDRLAKALVWDQSLDEVVDRTNVTVAEEDPNRLKAEGLAYIGLGMGGILAPSPLVGPSFGFGYRHELDHLALDGGFRVIFPTITDDGEPLGVSLTFFRIAALGYFNPTANTTPYLGGGLGFSLTAVDEGSGLGAQGEAIAGVELLRASTMRLFLQGEFIAPFYASNYWIPSLSATVGFAFHPVEKEKSSFSPWSH